jgi:hypothetical protein
VFGDVTFAQAPFAALGGRTLASSLSETASAQAALTFDAIRGGVVTETASSVAAVSSLNNILKAVAANTASALAAPNFAPSILNASLTETGSALDTTNFAPSIFVASQLESASAASVLSVSANLLATVIEAVSALDLSTNNKIISVQVQEAASGTGAQNRAVVFTGTVSEFASAVDTLAAKAIINANVTGIQLYVYVGNTLVWAVVDDSQSANWQNINDAQTAAWQSINDAQTPGWINIPT